MKERDRLLKKSLKTVTTCNRQIFTSLQNKVVKQICIAKASFFIINIIEEANGNGKLIWESLYKLLG